MRANEFDMIHDSSGRQGQAFGIYTEINLISKNGFRRKSYMMGYHYLPSMLSWIAGKSVLEANLTPWMVLYWQMSGFE